TATTENANEKATDLLRARANLGRSPDRLVIFYSANASDTNHPDRDRARGAAGARLLRSDDRLGREVLRVNGGDADAAALRIRGLPNVIDAYPDSVATATLAVNDPRVAEEWGLQRIQANTAWDTAQGSGVSA